MFASSTIVEDIPKEEKGIESKDELESRRILAICYPKASNPLCKDREKSMLMGTEELQGAVELYGLKEHHRLYLHRVWLPAQSKAQVEQTASFWLKKTYSVRICLL